MNIQEIVKAVVREIENAPVGSWASIRELAYKVDPDGCAGEDDFFKILNGVEETLKEHGKRRMDFHEFDGLVVGLPYNIEFVIRDAGSGPEFDYLVDWHFPDVE